MYFVLDSKYWSYGGPPCCCLYCYFRTSLGRTTTCRGAARQGMYPHPRRDYLIIPFRTEKHSKKKTHHHDEDNESRHGYEKITLFLHTKKHYPEAETNPSIPHRILIFLKKQIVIPIMVVYRIHHPLAFSSPTSTYRVLPEALSRTPEAVSPLPDFAISLAIFLLKNSIVLS